jgi:hypothetical protein
VLYAQVNHSLKVNDKLDEVQAELNDLKGIKPAEKAPAGSRLKMPGGGRRVVVGGAALAALARRVSICGMQARSLPMPDVSSPAAACLPVECCATCAAMPAMPAALANLTRRREDGSAKKHDSPGGGGNTSEVEMETPGPTTRRRAAAGATTATM